MVFFLSSDVSFLNCATFAFVFVFCSHVLFLMPIRDVSWVWSCFGPRIMVFFNWFDTRENIGWSVVGELEMEKVGSDHTWRNER